MIKITMINWEVKNEMLILWEKKKNQKNDDELRSEMRNANIMREEEESKERWWIEKWKEKC
jgi:hypothetical protein